MAIFIEILHGSWKMLLEASIYVLFGLLVGGLLKAFLSPGLVAKHLGRKGAGSVFKAALFGIPLPLCSCGVLPTAASLKKQGASNGATTAFLISTPESGVDSISITYALLDPIMTVARPLAAFFSAIAAGLTENFFSPADKKEWLQESAVQKDDDRCAGTSRAAAAFPPYHSFGGKILAGLRYGAGDLWHDIAIWFLVGIFLSGVITVLVPESLLTTYLGGGLSAMLIMLAAGIPLYICATASTPIAAALILKGVSPGAALVFLLVGPATNMASLTVLTGLLGRKATLRYLVMLSGSAVLCGVLLDLTYNALDISAQAVAGQAAEIIPYPLQLAGALLLLLLSINPVRRTIDSLIARPPSRASSAPDSCGCSGGRCNDPQPLRNLKGSRP
jgi:uncharacterized protein